MDAPGIIGVDKDHVWVSEIPDEGMVIEPAIKVRTKDGRTQLVRVESGGILKPPNQTKPQLITITELIDRYGEAGARTWLRMLASGVFSRKPGL